jgi:transposase
MPATPATNLHHYIGVDVSKHFLDVAFEANAGERLANLATAHRELIRRIRTLPIPCVVVVESSGPYHHGLVLALWNGGIEVCVVPPGRVRAFARALGLRAKTDRLDAQLLRRYGEACTPPCWSPPAREHALLRSLLEARQALIEQRTDWHNRLEGADALMRRTATAQINSANRHIARLEARLRAHLAQHETLAAHACRWQQVCGIGPVSAWTLLGFLPEILEAHSKPSELAGLVGVAPDPDESGTHHGLRHVSGGRWQVRCVLHMAARSAREHNPILRAFADRLEARGKPYKVIITAITRKLLHLLHRLSHDPDFSLAT